MFATQLGLDIMEQIFRAVLIGIGIIALSWASYIVLSLSELPTLKHFLYFIPSMIAFIASFLSNLAFTETISSITFFDVIRLIMLFAALSTLALSFFVDSVDKPLMRQWAERIFIFLLGLQSGKSIGDRQLKTEPT